MPAATFENRRADAFIYSMLLGDAAGPRSTGYAAATAARAGAADPTKSGCAMSR